MPTVITFDADGTLCDFPRMLRRSLAVALSELQRLVPGPESATLTVTELQSARDEVAEEYRGQQVRLEQVRHAAFERVLASLGRVDSDLAAHLTSVYFQQRFGEPALYDDVVPTLDALRGRYRLGLVSNGNSYPDRSGLAGHFAFTVFAHDHGVEKPDRRFYELVLAAAGVSAGEVVHVGDSLINDVGGAQSAGIRAVWLNRQRLPLSSPPWPDAEITSLSELPSVLHKLDVRHTGMSGTSQ